jgi:hypothetical protein
VIGVQPEHEGAKALLARVVEKVASGDPMPPENGGSGAGTGTGAGTASGTGPGSGAGTGVGPGTGASPAGDLNYTQALAKANQLAEDGNCGGAMEYYAKALSLKATSVEALTGEGYCQLDNKQFASAYSSFRSALAIDSRNERALWGFAQGYQQQGLTQKAIEAYQHYLEVYPDSAAAKKQIEHLGGGVSPDNGGGGGSASGGGGGSASGGGSDSGSNAGSGSGSASSAPTPPAGSGSASGNDPFGSGSGN